MEVLLLHPAARSKAEAATNGKRIFFIMFISVMV